MIDFDNNTLRAFKVNEWMNMNPDNPWVQNTGSIILRKLMRQDKVKNKTEKYIKFRPRNPNSLDS